MPLRHPAPGRSHTMVSEFQNRTSQTHVILLTASLGLISLLIASALGLPQKYYFIAFFVTVGVFLVLVNVFWYLRKRSQITIRKR